MFTDWLYSSLYVCSLLSLYPRVLVSFHSLLKKVVSFEKKNRRKCWVNEVKVIVLNVGLLSTQCSLKKKIHFLGKRLEDEKVAFEEVISALKGKKIAFE